MMDTEITANKYHFVRNHGGVPDIDAAEYFLDIDGLVNKPRRLTLEELQDDKNFAHESKVVTLQCSGCRRREVMEAYPGGGDELANSPWGVSHSSRMPDPSTDFFRAGCH
jgi:sulfite oxidase